MKSKSLFLLVGSVIVILMMKAYAADRLKFEKDKFGPTMWEEKPVQFFIQENPDYAVESISLNQWFNAGCALFGVHDKGLNDSQFFCIHKNTENKIQGQWFFGTQWDRDIEALTYDGSHIFFSSGSNALKKGRLYQTCNQPNYYFEHCRFSCFQYYTDGEAKVDGQAMKEVDGLAFDSNDSDGNLWGWAAESGLFMIPRTINPVLSDRNSAVMIYPMSAEVEDIEWIEGKLYGVLNIDDLDDTNAAVTKNGIIKANFVEYDPLTDQLHIPCQDEVITALTEAQYSAAEIEALEALPKIEGINDNYMLLGFHTSPFPGKQRSTLVLGVLNLTQCTLELQDIHYLPEEQSFDVEGLAMVCP